MENCYIIDYLTFTYKFSGSSAYTRLNHFVMESLEEITSGFLDRDKFEYKSYGRNHFNESMLFGGENHFVISASDSGKVGHTVMFNFSGQGIREVGTKMVFDIIRHFSSYDGFNCTRCDLAYDDFNHSIPLVNFVDTFSRFIDGEKLLNTRFSPDNAGIFHGTYQGASYNNVTFGRRDGSQYMRLYDKRAEQGSKKLSDSNDYWYRLELEIRHECAQTAIELLLANDFDLRPVYCKFLNRMFSVLSRGPNTESEKKTFPASHWLTGGSNLLALQKKQRLNLNGIPRI